MQSMRIVFFLIACHCAAAPRSTIARFSNSTISSAKADAAGNVLVAGSQGDAAKPDSLDGFVSKLSFDGATVLYSTKLAGSKKDIIKAMVVDSVGAVYVAGETASTDFPTTPGALQRALFTETTQGFVAKLDAMGNIVYATLLGDRSEVSLYSLVVNKAGEAIVSGMSVDGKFPASSIVPFTANDKSKDFVVKFDATGANIRGYGRGVGGILAIDDEGSVYVAGLDAYGSQPYLPVTPGAFQSGRASGVCGGTTVAVNPCFYQFVMKLRADLSQIVYLTYLNGTFGAYSSAIVVDAQRNVIVVGSTRSPDFPTTPNALMPDYIADEESAPRNCIHTCFQPPPYSGYVAKLNASGTGLLFSTFLSGTQSDLLGGTLLAADGLYIAAFPNSPDFPMMEGFPAQCLPATFVTRLSLDGSALSATRLSPGLILDYEQITKTILTATNGDLIRYDPLAQAPAIACILDAADMKPVTAIAPGETIALMGSHLGNTLETGLSFVSNSGPPLSYIGLAVQFNGIAAPLLYASQRQINVQAPFEIASFHETVVELTGTKGQPVDKATLPVMARNPVALLHSETPPIDLDCPIPTEGFYNAYPYWGKRLAVVHNEDGTVNSCLNRAEKGSVLKVQLSGLGLTTPTPQTGVFNANPAIPLDLQITLVAGTDSKRSIAAGSVVYANSVPKAISGTWELGFTLPADQLYSGSYWIGISVDLLPVRDKDIVVWLR